MMKLPSKEEGWVYDERNHAFIHELKPEDYLEKIIALFDTKPNKLIFDINDLNLILE